MPMAIPQLETERLILRGHRLADFEACARMWADPEVVRFIGPGKPHTRQQCWSRLTGYVGHWKLMGYGMWAVVEKAGGHYIGDVGFADFKRGIADAPARPELGWVLASEFHGKGYATEALVAATAWADANFQESETFCIIRPTHLASIRVAEKIGYGSPRPTRYGEDAILLFTRHRTLRE